MRSIFRLFLCAMVGLPVPIRAMTWSSSGKHAPQGEAGSYSDFFPLAVGRSWLFAYKSEEKIYDGLYQIQHNVDSGSVVFQVTTVSVSDSSLDWTIRETDRVTRHASGYEYGFKDTTLSIGGVSSFVLHEMNDSVHTLISKSYLPIWQLPPIWDIFGYAKGVPVPRYAPDSARMTRSDFLWAVAPAYYTDTMTFQRDVGLLSVWSHVVKGPNTPYLLNWSAFLLEYVDAISNDLQSRIGSPLLMQNYPNPFNPTTTIRYALPERTQVTLSVFNTLGQQVAAPVNDTQDAGLHEVRFDGSGLASGVYFYRLSAGGFIQTNKLVILR